MKRIIFFAASLFIISCQGNLKEQPKPNHKDSDWAHFKLNGEVHTVSERSVKFTNGTPEPGREQTSTQDTDFTFDDFGYLTNEKRWIKNEVPFEEIVYKDYKTPLKRTQYTNGTATIVTENQWDPAKENLLGILRRNPDNTQIDRIAYRLDKGNPVEKATYNNQDNLVEKITYGYNKKGKVRTEELYKNGITLQYRVQYEYDGENNKISETRYSTDKKLFTTNYEYSDKKVTLKSTTNSAGQPAYTETFTYNNTGLVTKHTTFENATNEEVTEIYTYDEKNNLLSVITSTTGQPQIEVTYTYDANDNVTTAKIKSGNDTVEAREFTYSYDKNKNWTKKTTLIGGAKAFEVTRKISYF